VALVKGAAYGKAEAHAGARPEGYAYTDVVQGKAIEKAKTGAEGKAKSQPEGQVVGLSGGLFF
jgi:hypothetical protein